MRLIGTTYFKKHATGFDTSSPSAHFLKFCDPSLTQKQQHSAWLEDIRQNIWHRIKFENEQIASDESLWLHWQRSCWVSNMWEQADKNVLNIGEVSDFGWSVTNNTISVVWDSQSNVMSIRQRVGALLRGCKCVTGCMSGRCGCRKKQQYCAEGCECKNCKNLESTTLTTAQPLTPTTSQVQLPASTTNHLSTSSAAQRSTTPHLTNQLSTSTSILPQTNENTDEDTVTMLEEIWEDVGTEVEEVMDFVFEGDGEDQVVCCSDYEADNDLSDTEY